MEAYRAGCTELRGQVTFRRPLSKRLVFFDLKFPTSESGNTQWVELLVKAGGDSELSPQDVRDIRDTVKLGDIVRAVGRYEFADSGGGGGGGGGGSFVVREMVVATRWRDVHPAAPFRPQPGPLRPRGARHGPDTGGGGPIPVTAVGPGASSDGRTDTVTADGGGGGAPSLRPEPPGMGSGGARSAADDGAGRSSATRMALTHPERRQDGEDDDVLGGRRAADAAAAVATAAGAQGGCRTAPVAGGGGGGGTLKRAAGGAADAGRSSGVAALEEPVEQGSGAVPAAAAVGGGSGSGLADLDASAPVAASTTAAGVGGSRLPVCKYWAATGRCPKGGGGGAGNTCRYDHPPQRGGARGAQQLYVRSRRSERLAAAAELGFVHEAGDAAKRRRAAVFCDWLVQTYDREFLNSGTGVLDIAGGRGALSFQLLLRCGVRATLVEPRPAKLSRSQHREVQLAVTAAAAPGEGTTAEAVASALGSLTLPQLQRRFEPALWRRRPASSVDGRGGSAAANSTASVSRRGDHGSGGTDGGDADGEDAAVRELLAGCSLVVGLHPDQATEAIMEFALEAHKPFALVPCCVFPRLFPHRRLRLPTQGLSPRSLPPPPQQGHLAESNRGSAERAQSTFSPPCLPDSNTSSSSMQQRHEIPVETYPQLISYLLQRSQLYDKYGNDGNGDGDGGGFRGGGGSGGREAGGGGAARGTAARGSRDCSPEREGAMDDCDEGPGTATGPVAAQVGGRHHTAVTAPAGAAGHWQLQPEPQQEPETGCTGGAGSSGDDGDSNDDGAGRAADNRGASGAYYAGGTKRLEARSAPGGSASAGAADASGVAVGVAVGVAAMEKPADLGLTTASGAEGGSGPLPWRLHQEPWLMLWRLATAGQQQNKPNPSGITAREGERARKDQGSGPSTGLDFGVRCFSAASLGAEVDLCGNLYNTQQLAPPPTLPPQQQQEAATAVGAPLPPVYGVDVLRWLEAQGELWERKPAERRVVAGGGLSRHPSGLNLAGTAVAAARAVEQGRAGEALDFGARAAAAATERVRQPEAETKAKAGPEAEAGGADVSLQSSPGPGNRGGAEVRAQTLRNAVRGGGGVENGSGAMGAARAPGPLVGVARLAFQGANQVVYRLPAAGGWR